MQKSEYLRLQFFICIQGNSTFELKNFLKNLELYDVENDPSERINIAKNHPEIVNDMLARYEDWFDEVTEERDEKGVQRIFIGTKAQPHVTLSRFDWGGPRVISRFDYGGPRVIEDNQLGYWQVKTEKGTYRISMDLPEIESDGVAHIKYNDVHVSLPIKKNQKQVVFEDVKIPVGTGNFHTYLKTDRLPIGPLFVDIVKLDQHLANSVFELKGFQFINSISKEFLTVSPFFDETIFVNKL